MRVLTICTLRQIFEYDGRSMWHYKGKRVMYKVLMDKPEGTRPLKTDNIRIDLQEVGWGLDLCGSN